MLHDVMTRPQSKQTNGALASENVNAAAVAIALFLMHSKLDEVERIQRPSQTVADFLHHIRRLQLGEDREHAGTGAPTNSVAVFSAAKKVTMTREQIHGAAQHPAQACALAVAVEAAASGSVAQAAWPRLRACGKRKQKRLAETKRMLKLGVCSCFGCVQRFSSVAQVSLRGAVTHKHKCHMSQTEMCHVYSRAQGTNTTTAFSSLTRCFETDPIF